MPTMSEFFFIPFFLKKANAFDNIQIKTVLSIFISPDEDRNRNEFSVWIKKDDFFERQNHCFCCLIHAMI
jgi:hypothetical protein